MLLDWFAREGWMIVNWWLLATLAGIAGLPLCLRLLGALPDRGYLLARTAGLLLTGFGFWLLATVGLLTNTTGSIALAWLIVLVIGLVLLFRGAPVDWRGWWRENRTGILVGELVFALSFLAWAAVRAHQHGLNGTEKPMDLAFLSAIVRSPQFPPNDPWLAGYSISYYYFGYVIAAMFTKLSGVVTTVGYNLWTAMLFGITSLTTYGVIYNLVKSRFAAPVSVPDTAADSDETPPRTYARRATPTATLVGLFGVLVMMWMGNWEFALVDLPYYQRTASAEYLQFWDVNQRQTPLPATETPVSFENWGGSDWWWFRAARAMNDRNLPEMVANGQPEREEVINEFPQFSFLLADNHPHVMSLPFTLLAVGLALNILLTPRRPSRQEVLFYGLIVGGLVFLNTWDAPIYVFVLVGADALRRIMTTGRLAGNNAPGTLVYHYLRLPLSRVLQPMLPSVAKGLRGNEDVPPLRDDDWLDLFRLGGALLLIMFVAYAPFIFNFRSQLGGILPNLIYPTLFQQYLLTFGPLVPLIAIFLLLETWRGAADRRMNWKLGWQVVGAILLVLVIGVLLFVLIGTRIPDVATDIQRMLDQLGGWSVVLPAILNKRITHVLTSVVLLLGLVVVVARLFPRAAAPAEPSPVSVTATPVSYPAATGFALLLVGAALGLTLIPEFLYLRDTFSTRMNTVFKFYYQAWALFALAATYGTYSLLADVRLRLPAIPVRALAGVAVVVAIGMGLLYPVYGIYARTMLAGTRITLDGEVAITLDGWRTVVFPDDYATLNCLSDLVGDDPVTVLEATGGSYDSVGPGPVNSGRTGALTGMPTVLGWQFHQVQWRGSSYNIVVGSRPDDVRKIYEDLRLDVVQPLIAQYEIDYILYGVVERSPDKYGSAGEQKFLESYEVVCESGNSRIYRVNPDVSLVQAGSN